jgi:uncharacterized DUF497 family protein
MDIHIVWDLDDDPLGNVQHILEHGITKEEVEEVLFSPASVTTTSDSSGERITFGHSGSDYLAVVWEHVMDNPLTMRPITAYQVPE